MSDNRRVVFKVWPCDPKNVTQKYYCEQENVTQIFLVTKKCDPNRWTCDQNNETQNLFVVIFIQNLMNEHIGSLESKLNVTWNKIWIPAPLGDPGGLKDSNIELEINHWISSTQRYKPVLKLHTLGLWSPNSM